MRDLGGAVSNGARAVASPRRWAATGRELRALPATLRRELWPLEATGLRSAHRRRPGRRCRAKLADLKRVEHAAGERDRERHRPGDGRGCDPARLSTRDEPMEAMRVQIGEQHHRDEDDDALGNDSFSSAPSRSRARPRAPRGINSETSSSKEHHDPDELYSFFHSLSHVRPLYRVASDFASGPREFALSVSNVPGPREPVSLLGGNVAELYSVAEPADRHALRASAISLAGQMGLGFCTDPGAVPGVGDLADGLDESLAELLELC
jgi:hypothetical protein